MAEGLIHLGLLTTSKLPKRFAIAGVVVGVFLYAVSRYIYKSNPFHIPNFKSAALMEFYPFPPLYSLLVYDLPTVFCHAIVPLDFVVLDRASPDSPLVDSGLADKRSDL